MKIRIAKKILFAPHWTKKWEAMRPMYFNEEKQRWTQPSWHDIPNAQFQKARRRYFGYWRHAGKRKVEE